MLVEYSENIKQQMHFRGCAQCAWNQYILGEETNEGTQKALDTHVSCPGPNPQSTCVHTYPGANVPTAPYGRVKCCAFSLLLHRLWIQKHQQFLQRRLISLFMPRSSLAMDKAPSGQGWGIQAQLDQYCWLPIDIVSSTPWEEPLPEKKPESGSALVWLYSFGSSEQVARPSLKQLLFHSARGRYHRSRFGAWYLCPQAETLKQRLWKMFLLHWLKFKAGSKGSQVRNVKTRNNEVLGIFLQEMLIWA